MFCITQMGKAITRKLLLHEQVSTVLRTCESKNKKGNRLMGWGIFYFFFCLILMNELIADYATTELFSRYY